MTDQDKLQPKIAWGITGAGHFLPSCVELLTGLVKADIFLSRAAQEVLASYGLFNKVQDSGHRLILDKSASCSSVTGLYTGKYQLVVIAPVTANTVAKMVCGIADNLISNLFAHAGKCRIPTIILPCDGADNIKSLTPDDKEVPVYVRRIDRENINRLARAEGVTLVTDLQQLQNKIKDSLR